MTKSTRLAIGRITRPHGILGEVKVQLFVEYRDAFEADVLQRVYLGDSPTAVRVRGARFHQDALLLRFDGVVDRNAAEGLRGAVVHVERRDLPEPAEGDYYATDLIGMVVYDEEGVRIGELVEVLATGSNDVFVVARPQGELLLPVIDSCVRKIDPAAERITVVIPEGLE